MLLPPLYRARPPLSRTETAQTSYPARVRPCAGVNVPRGTAPAKQRRPPALN